ncbi:MAG TPA: electron transport complex subunit RsxC [Eubacteriales bacterium]|nr:electron transport complex subunit RsxC [Eubacteriales bacterium]
MKKTFRGGVHPLRHIGEGKPLTNACPVRAVTPEFVVIPMGMHLGAPSAPCVEKGQRIQMGEVIATPVGGLGLPVHASVSGEVTFVETRQQLRAAPELCIGIRNDKQDDWVELHPAGTLESATPEQIVSAVKSAGICGMGGASFPTHIKLSIPEGKSADTVILNGAECEPYLTADHRLMLESSERIIGGLLLIMRATGVDKGVIAVEKNKPDAIATMQKAAQPYPQIEIFPLTTKYPQGSEKQLIHVVTGREVPRGKLPIDAQALVFNVSTSAAIFDAVTLGKPLVERITTVTGCVNEPGNLLLRVGTTYDQAFAACGGLPENVKKVFAGGPMTGLCASSTDISMTKATNGIVAFDETQVQQFEETACIRCARCVNICPIGLYPYLIRSDIDKLDFDAAKKHGLLDCVLCGACSYICPARRYLTSSFKAAREELSAKARKR